MLAAIKHTEQQQLPQSDWQQQLKYGQLQINSNFAALIQNDKLVQTWPITGWNLLEISQDERWAVFEAEDSWLLALLDLQTGEWHEDTDMMFPVFSLEEDQVGEYIYNHETKDRIYLRPESI